MFLKLGDMFYRGTYVYLLDGTYQTNAFIVEMLFGVIVPWLMLISKRTRESRIGVFSAATMIVFGVALNRINVFIVAYTSPVSENGYFPSIVEIFVTMGLIATLMFIYRFVVTFLPVLQSAEPITSEEVSS
jgi:Ni/Fe-hydrogenase subunit HybB-like protein